MTEDIENLAAELKRRGIPPKYFDAQIRRGMSSEAIVNAWPPPRPLSNRVGSRRFRRRLVIATYGGWLVVAVIVTLISLNSPRFWFSFALLFTSGIVQAIWLSRRTYINSKVDDAELDERLVQIKNQAFRTAFRVFSVVVVIGGLGTIVAMYTQPGYRGLTVAILIYFTVVLLAATLPTVIVAWREPDPTEPEPSSS